VICASTVTIIKDAQPNSRDNIHFTGDLGNFHLDDASPDDRDPFSRSQTFAVGPGVYIVTEQVPNGWLLTNISCDPAASAAVDLVNHQVTITVADDSAITCTFINQD
jgi:hypothetical protein